MFSGVGKNFRQLMQSYLKISNFPKNVHTIFIKFCTVILHPKVLLRARNGIKNVRLGSEKRSQYQSKNDQMTKKYEICFPYINPFPTASPLMRFWLLISF